ncbi:hypothetical protein SNOG_10982 [Parastagonospora nodorum SN15]|uniref:Uncharacterized protein n=1 Tax=Phaeosphaeria nodorum (strain SN15 / ATCC MYA-4574 / FGSC 10173) TaxID=321614 RepID=Q0UB82_PHANO|nr:hypothetical protein SNOG_10982 [Parastagonospora nodorum SN15]EAT81481.1 hypothetical protein SNOG_10982 [Parastagonospora nodorum SN15]
MYFKTNPGSRDDAGATRRISPHIRSSETAGFSQSTALSDLNTTPELLTADTTVSSSPRTVCLEPGQAIVPLICRYSQQYPFAPYTTPSETFYDV